MTVKNNDMPGVEINTRKVLTDLLTAPDFLERVPSTEHGAGAIGTYMAPKTLRGTINDTIITEIHVDLTGIGIHGATEKDALGLSAGGTAYIGRYVVAKYGYVYRIEMICLELPAAASGTIDVDIDLGAEDVGTTIWSGGVDDVVINTGGVAAGKMFVTNVPALTADDYLYIIEGGTQAGSTGVHSAGQLLFRFYGHAVLA